MRDTRVMFDNFISHTADRRAQHYREQAAKLRDLAEAERTPTFRASLFEVAAKYERLADEMSKR